jgi:hypothetical protein
LPVPKTGAKAPAWWVFTKVNSAFVEAARNLSDALTKLFGDDVSISHFEKAVGEIPALSDEERALLDIDEPLLNLLEKFLECRRARDAERVGFRSLKSVSTIEASLAKAKASLVSSQEVE